MPTASVAICSRCQKTEITDDRSPRFVDANGKVRVLPRSWGVAEYTTVHGCTAGELCEECGKKYKELINGFAKELGAPALPEPERNLPELEEPLEGMPPLTKPLKKRLKEAIFGTPEPEPKQLENKKE